MTTSDDIRRFGSNHDGFPRRPSAAALLGLLLWVPAASPVVAQEPAPTETSTATMADDPVVAIPGIWVRDERLSEDPIEKLEESYGQTFGGGPGRSPGVNPGSGRTGPSGRG